MSKIILNTERCKIELNGKGYLVKVAVGPVGIPPTGWLECFPFSPDQQGLVNALQLAVDVNAGRFYPVAVESGGPSVGFTPKLLK